MGLTLGAVAAVLGAALFLWADLHRRSAAAIDRHEEEARRTFGDLRLRHAAQPRLLDDPGPEWQAVRDLAAALRADAAMAHRYPFSLQRLLEGLDLSDRGVFFEYEEGGDHFASLRYITSWGGRYPRRPPELSPGEILPLLALVQDSCRGGDVNRGETRFYTELSLLEFWPDQIYGHELGAEALETLARMLDRVEEARPPIADALEAQHAMDRMALIQVLRTRSNPRFFNRTSPDWRSFYSTKVLFARDLKEMDRSHRRAQEIARLSIHDRPAAAKKLEEEARGAGEPPTAAKLPLVASLFEWEVEAYCAWELARVATGVAWYQAERREDPPDLAALVPRYLSRVPDCPRLRYAAGEVFRVGPDGKRTQVTWSDFLDVP